MRQCGWWQTCALWEVGLSVGCACVSCAVCDNLDPAGSITHPPMPFNLDRQTSIPVVPFYEQVRLRHTAVTVYSLRRLWAWWGLGIMLPSAG